MPEETGDVEKAQTDVAEAQEKLTTAADFLDEGEIDDAREQIQEAIEALQTAVKNL